MRTWSHDERLLRRPKTQDSLLSRSRDAQGPSGPHLLCEPLFGQTLRAEGRARGSLAPKKRPGAAPKLDEKAMKLLEDDLKERPFATLRERCQYLGVVAGLSVSRSTVCRAIARTGPTRKKGGVSPPSATSS
jgi:hypothetical protein